MDNLKVFSNSEFGELGVLELDGKEYFPATQCAKLLGYAEPAKAIRTYCKGVSKMDTPTNGGIQSLNYINEGDLYRLIVSSKLPAAEKFERWVFDEVLPAIRKSGSYGAVNIEDVIAKTATAVVMEVVRQLVPVLAAAVKNKPKGELAEERTITKTEYKRYFYKTPSKMEALPETIRQKAENMLLSRKYSCQQVADFIIDNGGGYISQAAVNRYAHKELWV